MAQLLKKLILLLQVKQAELQTFDENCKQLAVWLDGAEIQLGSELPLKATLDEKKAQLLNYKVMTLDKICFDFLKFIIW